MKSTIKNNKFNTKMETSDWRYCASIVGLIKYFNYMVSIGVCIESELYKIEHDTILYNSDDITEERYLLFAEYYFEEAMHHKVVEEMLNHNELTDEQVNLVNEKLKANSIMKRVFGGNKFSGDNKNELLDIINKNRFFLIKETFRSGKSLYANYANPNSLFLEQSNICRVLNYYLDVGKKSKSISYNWDFKTYNFLDEKEFDFIPFAFSKSREAFFINNNYSIKQLFNTNDLIGNSENPRSALFTALKNSSNFIDFDVEVIVKDRSKDYFQTLFIRKDAINIFEKAENYKAIKIKYKINDNYYIDFEREVTNNIVNNIRLDSLIEILLKANSNHFNTVKTLININKLIYGGDEMDKSMKSAYASAKKVILEIPENKVNSYKQKLINAITFKDYGRFCEILLQLSAYSGVVFDFAYDLFEDFDENKNIAYTFINALNTDSNKVNGGERDA